MTDREQIKSLISLSYVSNAIELFIYML